MSDSPSPPGDGMPESDGSPEMPSFVEFVMTVTTPAMDAMLRDHGICPTNEVRHTVARELYKFAPLWLTDIVHQVARRVVHSN